MGGYIDNRNEGRQAQARRRTQVRRREPATARRQAARGASPRRRPRPTRAEIRRNRIVAAIVLVILVVLLANLVMCAAAGIAGFHDAGASTAAQSAGASATGQSAAASTAAQPANAEQGAENGQAASTASGEAVASVVAQAAGRAVAAKEATSYDGVEDPWVAGGRFTTGDPELDQLVKGFCDGNSTEGASAAENAATVFARCTWADFEEHENNQHPMGPTWDIGYAKQFFESLSGNCYDVSAAGEYVMKYFGYGEAYAEPCLILRQSGEYGDHGLVYVTDFDGRKCLCDVAFGLNGWMLDADVYTVKLVDIGQDPSEFTIADFEEVVPAPWIAG